MKQCTISYPLIQQWSWITKQWMVIGYTKWDVNMKMCYIPPFQKFIFIGIPFTLIKNKKHCIHTANRLHIYDHQTQSIYTTIIQLPRIDTIYTISLTHDKQTNKMLTFAYTNNHYKSIPLQLKLIISQYIDIWTLHIIDDHCDHYFLDIDVIMNSDYP